MKRIFLLYLIFFVSVNVFAQLRLDVDGEALFKATNGNNFHFVPDVGGSGNLALEMRTNGGLPFIDISDDLTTDFDARIGLDANKLTFQSLGYNFYGTAENIGLEIRANGGLPFIDLSNDATSDFDARILLTSGDQLSFVAPNSRFLNLAGKEQMLITSNGRVGIGTNPVGRFHVLNDDPAGNQGTQNALISYFERNISGATAQLGIYGYPNNALVSIPYLRGTSMIFSPAGNIQIAANNSSDIIRFHVGGWTSESTEKMRINNNEVRINSNATILGTTTLEGSTILNGGISGNMTVNGRIKLTQGGTRWNVCLGTSAGQSLDGSSSTGEENTFLGVGSGENITTGYGNTFVGFEAVKTKTTTRYGTTLGYKTLLGWYSTAIGAFADASLDNSTAIGYRAKTTANNQVVIGRTTIGTIGGYKAWSVLSDGRFKHKIKEDVPGLAFISKLRPITYHRKSKELDAFVRQDQIQLKSQKESKTGDRKTEIAAENSNKKVSQEEAEHKKSLAKDAQIKFTGFIAQEVEEAANALGYDFDGVVKPQNDQDHYSLRYGSFVVPLVKAIQEQQSQLLEKEDRIEKLESDVAELKELLKEVIASKNNPNTQKAIIEGARLGQNMPNPFNENTKIPYAIPQNSLKATIQVHGINGQLIKTIPVTTFGEGVVEIQTRGLSNGQYTYTLEVDGRVIETKKMNLVK